MDDVVEYLRWLRSILPTSSNVVAYSWLGEQTHYYIEQLGVNINPTFADGFKVDAFIKQLETANVLVLMVTDSLELDCHINLDMIDTILGDRLPEPVVKKTNSIE